MLLDERLSNMLPQQLMVDIFGIPPIIELHGAILEL